MSNHEGGWGHVDGVRSEGLLERAPDHGYIPTAPAGNSVNVLIDGSHTRGLTSFLEFKMAPHAEGPPPHWHPGHDELFYIVQGKLDVLGDTTRKVYGPRDFVFIPRGVVHSFFNPGDEETIFVSGWSPPGAEQAFIKAHELLARFGVEEFADIPYEVMAEELIPLIMTNPAPEGWPQ